MKINKSWKRIFAGMLAAMMVFTSIDAGCITALAAELQVKEEVQKMQPINGYIDLEHRAGRIDVENPASKLPLHSNENIPEQYSSVEMNYVTSVKNQDNWGVCWAFAACAAMESYVLAHGYVDNPAEVDFSEYALAYLTYNDYDAQNPDPTGDYTYAEDEHMDELFEFGGNDEYAFKALSNWSGIYDELDDDTYYEDSLETGVVEKYIENPNNIRFILTGQKYINMQDMDLVKQAVMEHGAVSIGYNADTKYCSSDMIYNYNYETPESNHGVVIVGWDDTIDKNLFTMTETIPATGDSEAAVVTHTPDNNGAWLVKNSWGTWDGYDGYIWISYEDLSVLSSNAVVYEVAPKETYDNIYQHDGATVFASYCQAGKFASVFDITGEKNQLLEAVSFALCSTDANYTVSIYKTTDENILEDGELLTTQTGSTTYEGYYTVVLEEPVLLQEGDTIAVVVGFDDNEYVIIGDNNADLIEGYSTVYSSSELGQNYIWPSAYLQDYYFDMAGDNGYDTSRINNLCLKAFTSDAIRVPENIKTVDSGRKEVTISWDKIENAIGYEVWKGVIPSDANGTTIRVMNDENNHYTSYVDEVELGKAYFYKVAAIYADDTSISGEIKSEYSGMVMHKAAVPNVKNLGCNDNFYQKMIYKWQPLGSIVDGYVIDIYRGSILTDDYKIDSIVIEGGDVSAYEFDTSAYPADTTINCCIYAYIDDAENRYLSSKMCVGPGGYTKDEPLNVDVKWHVTTIDDVDYLVIDVNELLNDNESAQEKLRLWYYTDVNESGPEHIFPLDMSDGRTTFMYSFMEHRISYEDVGYVYITDEAKDNAFQDEAFVIGGDYKEPVLEDVEDQALTSAGQVIELEAVIEPSSQMENFKYTYQWYVAEDATGIGAKIAGATDTVYKVQIGSFDEKFYYCEVTAEYPVGDELKHVFVTSNGEGHTRVVGELYGTEVVIESIENQIFTGSEIVPTIVVKDKNTGNILENGKDYEVSFSNNKNVGKAEGLVIFKGDYENAPNASVFFDITPKSAETLELFSVEDVTYTGEAFVPKGEVWDTDRNVVLAEGVDYELTYNANVNAGTAVITVSFIGNYTGTEYVNFKINQKSAEGVVVSNNLTQEYAGFAIIPDLIIKDGEKKLELNKDYKLSCTNNIDVGTAHVTIIFIGNYVGEKTTTFAIVKKSADALWINSIENQYYTGHAITPGVEIVYKNGDNAVVLKNEVDYTATYTNNTELGVATVTLVFNGNFEGTREITFNIVPQIAENLTYNQIETITYDGTPHEPELVIKNGDILLVSGEDYVVEYYDNVNAGTAKAIVKFEGFEGCSGYYTGTKELTFQIAPKVATQCSVTLETLDDYTYNGLEFKPGVVVMDGEKELREYTEELEAGEGDYIVTYSNNINAGEATVTIQFINNYTGESTQIFTIERMEITEEDIVIEDVPAQIYCGAAIVPAIVVKDSKNDVVLQKETYTVTGSNNVFVGEGRLIVNIALDGNYIYVGEAIEVTFEIVPRSSAKVVISDIPTQRYNGNAITPELEIRDAEANIVLVKDRDYTVEYKDNVYEGVATVVVNFKGNFEGETMTKTFSIIDPVPTSITSNMFYVDQIIGYISKITVGTTASTLWTSISEKDYVVIIDKNGATVPGETLLATGMQAVISDEGTITKRYSVIVTGDTNGDGKINITDMIAVKACTLKKSDLSGVYEKAGDVNGDGKINITDFIKVKATTLKKDTITGVVVN